MSQQETFTIEVDGRTVEAVKGEMVIEATDRAGIHIPRFCYHKHLPIAANCRMCLVDVEKAPKPMPACATPVADGMKITTDSQRALTAQRGVMEFLLINHPLDCPICDQGGECELQDLALGFGRGVSRFVEGKRSVADEDLGPLVATEMTRCIHCTRCVRFLDTVAGNKELGGMFRGERTEIKTYVGEGLRSELSGNVIDLCPVGALTNKPFRFRARPWEMLSFPAVGPHDGVGSNLELHVLRGRVLRVVPRENEAVNQTWLADRDRFGIEGLYSEDRLERPMVKEGGQWREVPWEVALQRAAESLQGVAGHFGPEALGALLAPTATVEELYLAGQLMRGLGSGNVDHRLREGDTSDQAEAPPFPYLGQEIAELARRDAVLLVGAYPRHEQPMINHRLRQAAQAGAAVMALNPRRFDWNFELAVEDAVAPGRMVGTLAAVACALAEGGKDKSALPDGVAALAVESEAAREMARRLAAAERPTVLVGSLAAAHPRGAELRALGSLVAELAGGADGTFGVLAEAANTAGGWLAGAVPHRTAGGAPAPRTGLDARRMVEEGLKGYLLLNVEPEADLWNPAAARRALAEADRVVAITVYADDALKEVADILLPMGGFGETGGTFVNNEGRWQSFRGVAQPVGASRPGWKILRALGTLLELDGFAFDSVEEVHQAVAAACEGVAPGSRYGFRKGGAAKAPSGVELAGGVPIYAGDPLVRRSAPLQASPLAGRAEAVASAETAGRLGLNDGGTVRLEAAGGTVELPLRVDDAIPADTIWVPAALSERADLGPPFGPLTVTAV